jgi:hypothetical protein
VREAVLAEYPALARLIYHHVGDGDAIDGAATPTVV